MDHRLNSEWPIPCANPGDWKARRKQIDSARTVARTWSIYLITVRMISNIDKLTLGQLLGHSARKPLTIAEPLRPHPCKLSWNKCVCSHNPSTEYYKHFQLAAVNNTTNNQQNIDERNRDLPFLYNSKSAFELCYSKIILKRARSFCSFIYPLEGFWRTVAKAGSYSRFEHRTILRLKPGTNQRPFYHLKKYWEMSGRRLPGRMPWKIRGNEIGGDIRLPISISNLYLVPSKPDLKLFLVCNSIWKRSRLPCSRRRAMLGNVKRSRWCITGAPIQKSLGNERSATHRSFLATRTIETLISHENVPVLWTTYVQTVEQNCVTIALHRTQNFFLRGIDRESQWKMQQLIELYSLSPLRMYTYSFNGNLGCNHLRK